MKQVSKCILIRGKRTLLTKRANTVKYNPNKWSCPGGHLEEGETYEEAAIRELKEETNLDFVPREMIFKKISEKKELRFFIGLFSGRVTLQEEELDGWAWFTYEEAKQLNMTKRYFELLEILKERKLI